MTFRPDKRKIARVPPTPPLDIEPVARVAPAEPLDIEPVARVRPAPPLEIEPVGAVRPAPPLDIEPIAELEFADPLAPEPVGEVPPAEPLSSTPEAEPLALESGGELSKESGNPESPPIQGNDLDFLFEVPQFDDPDMEIRDVVGLDVERDIVGGSLDEATSVTEEDILGDSFDVSDPDELSRPPTPPFRSQRPPRRRPPLPPAGGFIAMR